MAPRNNFLTSNRSIWLGIPYPKHDVNTSVSLAASQVQESEQENEESKIYLNVHIIYIYLHAVSFALKWFSLRHTICFVFAGKLRSLVVYNQLVKTMHFDAIFNTHAFNRRSKRGLDVVNFWPWNLLLTSTTWSLRENIRPRSFMYVLSSPRSDISP